MKSKTKESAAPNGWLFKTLGCFIEKIEGGGTPSKKRDDFWNGNIPWASVKDIVTHNPCDTQDHISVEALKNSSSRLVPKGTLIIPTRMALGHAVIFDVDVAINQDLKAVYPKKDLLNKYLYYWFQYKKRFIERLGAGSTVAGIQVGGLKAIKVNMPPYPEQKRIVGVLGVWDEYLEKLARKIEIKKQIKKGLMQQLLTGKKRLKGFVKSWSRREIGTLGTIYGGLTGKSGSDFGEGKPYLTYMNIYSNSRTNLNNVRYVKIGDDENQNKVKYGDLFFTTSSETPTEVGITSVLLDDPKEDVYLNSFCFGFRLIDPHILSPHFARFYFRGYEFRKNMFKIAQGASRYNLAKKYFLRVEVYIPDDAEEQENIASVLNLIENEIDILQKKQRSIELQKKYLLSNLITGQIRTPENLLEGLKDG